MPLSCSGFDAKIDRHCRQVIARAYLANMYGRGRFDRVEPPAAGREYNEIIPAAARSPAV
jgi:hypothetical protein